MNITVVFKPHEAVALIGCREARNIRLSVFLCSTRNAIGHATVQNPATARDDIDVIVVVALRHWLPLRTESELQIPPLRYAPVGMTKSKAVTLMNVSEVA
jgi:hypothetical protein